MPGGTDDCAVIQDPGAHASSPFGTPVNVPEVNLAGKEANPCLSYDGHTLYFTRETGAQGIYAATRLNSTSPFSEPELLCSGSSPAISADGLTLYGTASDPAEKEYLAFSTRSRIGDPFGAWTKIDVGVEVELIR